MSRQFTSDFIVRERINSESNVECYTNLDTNVPSPAKKSKTTTDIHLPETSIPNSDANTANSTTHSSRISALIGSNTWQLNSTADSPRSNESISSNNTVPYDYTGITFDMTTVPFSPRTRPGLDSTHFAEDSTQNAVDSFPSTSSYNTQRKQNDPIAKRRLSGDNTVISHTSTANRSLDKQQATNNNNNTSNNGNVFDQKQNSKAIEDTLSETLQRGLASSNKKISPQSQPSIPTYAEFISSQSPMQLPALTGGIDRDIPNRERKSQTEPDITNNNVELLKSASESSPKRTAGTTLKEPNNVSPTSSTNSVSTKSKEVISQELPFSRKEISSIPAQPTDGAIKKLYIIQRQSNKVDQQCLKMGTFDNEHNASTPTSQVPNVTSQNQSPKVTTVDNKPSGSAHTQPSPQNSMPKSQTSNKNSSNPPKVAKKRSSGRPRKRGYRFQSKCSPSQNRKIKSLKAKKEKQLQVKQLNELEKLVETVETNRHLKHILIQEEKDILTKLMHMEENQKHVVMKLFVGNKMWDNIFKLCSKAQMQVADDKDITDIYEFLANEGFVYTDYAQEDMASLLENLDSAQVEEIMIGLRIESRKSTSKKEMIGNIVKATRQSTVAQKTIMEKITHIMGLSIKIKDEVCNALYHVYLLATFTNPVLNDIQRYFQCIIQLRVVFPGVPLADCPVFLTRDKFLKYAEAIKLRHELDDIKNKPNKKFAIAQIGKQSYGHLQLLEPDDGQDHKNAPHLKRFTAEHVYSGVLWTCCENLFTKQTGEPMEVEKWVKYLIGRFPESFRLGEWYRLLIRLHLQETHYEEGAKLLIDVLETKSHLLSERDKYELRYVGKLLKSSKKYMINQMYHDRLTLLLPRKIDTSTFPPQQIDHQSNVSGKERVARVEQVALEYYAENGFPGGHHCKGSLVKALMTLYFWDIIYNPNVPGTFISTLQAAPLDFRTPYFFENRKKEIEARLEQISIKWSEKDLLEFGVNNWRGHSHETSAFEVIQDCIRDCAIVEILVTVIDRKILAKIFERLIKNVWEFSSGMPDLLVWNVDQKIHKFVEVKGESDILTVDQTLWLQYLKEIGASIEVCTVHSLGPKRKKNKKVCIGKDGAVAQDDGEVASTSRNEDRCVEED